MSWDDGPGRGGQRSWRGHTGRWTNPRGRVTRKREEDAEAPSRCRAASRAALAPSEHLCLLPISHHLTPSLRAGSASRRPSDEATKPSKLFAPVTPPFLPLHHLKYPSLHTQFSCRARGAHPPQLHTQQVISARRVRAAACFLVLCFLPSSPALCPRCLQVRSRPLTPPPSLPSASHADAVTKLTFTSRTERALFPGQQNGSCAVNKPQWRTDEGLRRVEVSGYIPIKERKWTGLPERGKYDRDFIVLQCFFILRLHLIFKQEYHWPISTPVLWVWGIAQNNELSKVLPI